MGLNDQVQAILTTVGAVLSSLGGAATLFGSGNTQLEGVATLVIGAGALFVKELQGVNFDSFQPFLDELKALRAAFEKANITPKA